MNNDDRCESCKLFDHNACEYGGIDGFCCCADVDSDQLVQRICDALNTGNIRAIGGTVYDTEMQYLCSTSDLAAVRHLIPFERIDAGGSPIWQKRELTPCKQTT